jgi:hypothetical protein
MFAMEPETSFQAKREEESERRSSAFVVLIGAAILIEALFLMTVLFVGATT